MENTIWGNGYSIERGLISIFTPTLPNKEDNNSTTSLFQGACHRLGGKIVVEIIEDTLQQQQPTTSSLNDNSNNDQTLSVHVDGIYFLLRRQPDVLLRCRSNSSI